VTKQEYDALVEFALAKKKNGLSNSQIREELLVYEEDGEQIPSETIKNVLIAADERHLQELQSGGEFRLPKLSTTWKSVILLLFLIPLIIGFLYGLCPRIFRAYPFMVWLKVHRSFRVCEIGFHQKV
jgi:hypothetical protein